MTFVVYEWETGSNFKLLRVVPEAIRLQAHPGESADDVLRRCPARAAAFAFHINVTFSSEFPHHRSDLVAGLESRGIVPINAAIVDISKRSTQAQCAALGLAVTAADPTGDPDERLIVKTNHNFGGRSERLLTEAQLAALRIPRPSDIVPGARDYPVLKRRDVEPAWWTDPALAIERFIENRDHCIYRVGVAGSQFNFLRLINPNPIKKVHDARERVTILCERDALRAAPIPGIESAVGRAIVRFVDGFGLDFGSIDVICDDAGTAYVVDVNSTPWGPAALRRLMSLRRGLFELVAERASRRGLLSRPLGRGTVPTMAMVVGQIRRAAT